LKTVPEQEAFPLGKHQKRLSAESAGGFSAAEILSRQTLIDTVVNNILSSERG
jgi:hypothetical protein